MVCSLVEFIHISVRHMMLGLWSSAQAVSFTTVSIHSVIGSWYTSVCGNGFETSMVLLLQELSKGLPVDGSDDFCSVTLMNWKWGDGHLALLTPLLSLCYLQSFVYNLFACCIWPVLTPLGAMCVRWPRDSTFDAIFPELVNRCLPISFD